MVERYYKIENYTMKCRLYPNKTQAEQIDNLIDAARLFHNAALYDILENRNPDILIEKKAKDSDEVVHFIDFYKMKTADYINTLREKDPRIARLPGGALSGKSKGVVEDMKKAWQATGKHPIENFGKKYKDKQGNEITIGISYYNKKRKRRSYSFQTGLGNIIFTDNPKVLRMKIISKEYPVDGTVKIKGFNNKLRFDMSCEMDFRNWCETYKKAISITVSKDNCGDYYISFSLPSVYKPIKEQEKKVDMVGIDVGEIDIMTTYDGENIRKYGNLSSANRKIKHEQDGLKLLDRRMSRAYGWSNKEFRDDYKRDKSITPSKAYLKKDLADKKLSRKMQRQRRDWQSTITMRLLGSTNGIAVEGLRVKDMFD